MLCPDSRYGQSEETDAGGVHPYDDDAGVDRTGQPPRRVGCRTRGDGSDVGLLEAGVLPARSTRTRPVAGQCPRREASAGTPQDRRPRCGLVVQGRRTTDAAPELRTTTSYPSAAGSDPLPRRPGRCPRSGKEPGRETARGCLHQTLRRGLGHLRCLRARDDGRIDRRRAGSEKPSHSWPGRGCGRRSACSRRR